MDEIVWQKMRREDISQVIKLERRSFTVPWSEQAFCDEITNKLAFYLLGWMGDQVIAYAGMWLIVDEAHITNVAVDSHLRGKGIGKRLMQQMLTIAAEHSAKAMTLEVRPSNKAALALYNNLGFERAGIRKNYYEDTHEDALILWLQGEVFVRQVALLQKKEPLSATQG